ncbi:MAG: SpoIIE family protein phosphatase [Paludibacteraceae bacterium]|nr:SpoIIE family protein phosphatase [Paludibacteraceae bacterium]
MRKSRAQNFLETILFYGRGQKDAKGKRMFSMLHLALFIFFSTTIVFLVTASVSYTATRNKAMKDANIIMNQNMALATEIINKHVMSVENAGYSLASILLDKKIEYDENGKPYPKYFINEEYTQKSIDQLYDILERFVRANPHLWGAAFGYEPHVYEEKTGKSIAPFVRHTNDTLYERLNLPDNMNDYKNDDWYKTTKKVGRPRWCLPFTDIKGEVISCFCIPVYQSDGRYLGTIAVDMRLRGFSEDLKREIHPYKGSEVMVIGPGNMFLVHPDQSCVMSCSIESIEKFEKEKEEKDATLFYQKMDSDQMIVAVSCPNNAIYAEIDELLRKLMSYIGWGLFFVEFFCLMIFLQLKRLVESKVTIEGELTIASNIQKSMLPMMFPAFPDRNDLDLYATLKPAKSIGGDLYDYVIRKNSEGHDTLVFAIGDVSGKGVPASLLMAVVCSLFRDMAMKSTDPKVIASDINNCISIRNEYNMFCTMFVGSLDLETGLLSFCNAGHNQPIMLKDGKACFLDVIPNIPLGAFENFEYESESIMMDNGEMLFAYTDGVTEAENTFHNDYSDGKLLKVLNEMTTTKTIDVVNHVAKSVHDFAGNTEQSDDITMLAIKLNKDIKVN